jgi:N-acetylneuraminic acid mutarotase
MAVERWQLGLCELNGELYATGGLDADEETLASVERYDPSEDTWSAAPALPRHRYGRCACAVADAMYVIGGTEPIEGEDEQIVGTVLKFDSRTQTWSEMAPMPAERYCAGACVLGSAIYVFGGCDAYMQPKSTTYRFNTESNT